MELYHKHANNIISECRLALEKVDASQTKEFLKAIQNADKVFFVGVGRVLLSLEAIAKRWAHLGINTYIVGEVTEPAITSNDLLIVGSGSGESLIPVAIAKKAKGYNAQIAYIGSNTNSTVASVADVIVRIPVRTKLGLSDEINSKQPMTSLFEQSLLLYGDTLTGMMIEENGIILENLWQQHANLE